MAISKPSRTTKKGLSLPMKSFPKKASMKVVTMKKDQTNQLATEMRSRGEKLNHKVASKHMSGAVAPKKASRLEVKFGRYFDPA